MKAQARVEIKKLILLWYNTKTDWLVLRDGYFQVK